LKAFADEVETKTVTFGDLEFELKPLSTKDSSEITEGSMDIDTRTGQASMNTAEATLERLEKVIASWNLTDKDGEDLEVNRENIERLRDPITAELLRESREIEEVSPEVEKK